MFWGGLACLLIPTFITSNLFVVLWFFSINFHQGHIWPWGSRGKGRRSHIWPWKLNPMTRNNASDRETWLEFLMIISQVIYLGYLSLDEVANSLSKLHCFVSRPFFTKLYRELIYPHKQVYWFFIVINLELANLERAKVTSGPLINKDG